MARATLAVVASGWTLLLVGAPASAQDCPTGKPAIVSRAVPAALGQSPLWVTAGSHPIKWESSAAPVQLVWVIDRAARGQIIVTGKHAKSGALLKFTRFGDTLGERQSRYQLDSLGYKPSLAKADDLKKFGFDRNYAWFPEPGCYEITGRVGRQQTKIFLQVGADAKTTRR
jgi:hypothetical protein